MSLTAEQQAVRRTGIGGSEIAAVAGLSPWASPIDVWRAKVEGLYVDETPAMKRGRILESAVADWYAEDFHATLREVGTIRHPSCKVALATPDRIAKVDGVERLLEIKTANFRAAENWGPSGGDQVPLYYLAQVAWELACTDMDRADLAVLIAGDDFRAFPVERDRELEGQLLEVGEKFWRDYVVTKTPPPADGSESCSRYLAARYPQNKGPILEADADAHRWAAQLLQARADARNAEAREREARNNLISLIGEADGVASPTWKITYRSNKGRASVDWASVCSEAGVAKSIVDKHTKRTPFRRFCVSGEEVADE